MKKLWLSLLAVSGIAYAQVQIGNLPPATLPLSGTEKVALAQTGTGCPAPGCTRQTSVSNLTGGGGTPGGANTNVQFNNAGAFGGVNDLSWILGTDTLLLGSSSLAPTIQPNAVAATANGISLTINGGFDGVTSGTAGALNLNGGSSQTTGNAGAVNITGGNVQNNTGSGTGTAGAVNIIGGGTASFFSGTVVGGSVNINGGAGLGGHNGNVSITGGQGLNGSDAPGNVTIAAGSTAVQGQVTVHSGQSTLFLQQQGTPEWSLGNSAVAGNRLTGTSIGGVQLGAPTGGDCGAGCFAPQSIRVGNGTANVYTGTFNGSSTSGQSLGVRIAAGTNGSDVALLITNQAGSTILGEVFGDGGTVLGSPTGGDRGPATLNTASQIFVNNVAVVVGMAHAASVSAACTAGGCTATNPVNVSSTITRNSAGNYTVTLLTFGGQPACVVSANGTAGGIGTFTNGGAGTGTVIMYVATTPTDESWNLVCLGN